MPLKTIIKSSFVNAWRYRDMWWIIFLTLPFFGFYLFTDFNITSIPSSVGFYLDKEPTILESFHAISSTGFFGSIFDALASISALKLIGFGVLVVVCALALIFIHLVATQSAYSTIYSIVEKKPVENTLKKLFPSFGHFASISIIAGIINGVLFSWIVFPILLPLGEKISFMPRWVWIAIVCVIFVLIDLSLNTIIKWAKYNTIIKAQSFWIAFLNACRQCKQNMSIILLSIVINGLIYGVLFIITYYVSQLIMPIDELMTYVFADIAGSSVINLRFPAFILFLVISFVYTRFVMNFVWMHAYSLTNKK